MRDDEVYCIYRRLSSSNTMNTFVNTFVHRYNRDTENLIESPDANRKRHADSAFHIYDLVMSPSKRSVLSHENVLIQLDEGQLCMVTGVREQFEPLLPAIRYGLDLCTVVDGASYRWTEYRYLTEFTRAIINITQARRMARAQEVLRVQMTNWVHRRLEYYYRPGNKLAPVRFSV